MASPSMPDVYRQYLLKLIVPGLQNLVGKPVSIVTSQAQFLKEVSDPIWQSLPHPLKMMGREKLGWDQFLMLARAEAFTAAPGGIIAVRADVMQRLLALVDPFVEQHANLNAAPAAVKPVTVAKPRTSQVVLPPPADLGVAIGIDLGTTYSVVAYVDSHGRPTSIVNSAGDIITPSVILLDSSGPVIGKEAVLAAAMEPEKIAVCVKRDMGSQSYRKKVNGESFPPEVLSSLILRALKADAERKLGPVTKAVITVPAYFDELRRQATIDAGKLAGLDVLDIINEPTAAAIAYGYEQGFMNPQGGIASAKPIRVLVYDLGGGTFDVTILEIHGNSFKALATDGDNALGGKDWDEALVEMAAEAFAKQHGKNPCEDPSSLLDLFLNAETAKKTLSERAKATIYVNHQGSRLKVDVTREQFEEATNSLLSRTRTTTEIVVRQAGLTWPAIDRILVVGGSSRMPQVGQMLQALTGKKPERSLSVDEAIAHGAALYANLLLQKQQATPSPAQFSVTNVNSHSLGIIGVDPKTTRRRNQILIPKNTPLPHAVSATFKTSKPGQPNVVIRIVEGESENPEACIQIGICTINNLPPHLPAGTPVRVSYAYQTNGQLQVSGQVLGQTGVSTTVFQRETSLNAEQMQMWTRYVDSINAPV